MELEIRYAGPDDAEAVHRIVEAAFAEYRGVVDPLPEGVTETLEEVQADIAEGCVLVTWRGGEAVGTARYRIEPASIYIRRVAVPPCYRGQGIAEALMLHIEALALGLGRNLLTLSTRKSLPRNLKLYEKLGYIVTSVEPHPRGPDWTVSFEKRLEAL